MELILGTAEFGHPDYAPHPDKRTIVRILNRAWEAGIRKIDVADTYNLDFSLFGGFKQIMKSRELGKGYYHYQPGEATRGVGAASVYDIEQLQGLTQAIIPYNINNTTFASVRVFPVSTYIRSVFDNGKLLKEGYTVRDCIQFVKHLNVQGVIVGVRKVGELEEILEAFQDR